jgi:histidinol-phosphatase
VSWESELRFAEHLADIADSISRPHFRRAETAVRVKPDGTPVTEADEAIERALRHQIEAAYPNHDVLGEEEGATEKGSRARWIIDPIDGTKNFSWGIPIWATLIALEVEGEIVCGVASAPALDERFTASRSGGAHRNGAAIRVSAIDRLADARIAFTTAPDIGKGGFGERLQRLIHAAAHNRGIGDFYGHMLVAAGSLDAMIEPALEPWDIGPLIVILEEAGGRLSDFGGNRHIYGKSCLSTNGLLHEEILKIVGTAG